MGNFFNKTEEAKATSKISRGKQPEISPKEILIIGNEIRCRNNHTCCEHMDNRKNNIHQVLERNQLTCELCSKTLDETEGSFWSCTMCNFDACSNCVENEATELEKFDGARSVAFIDDAGVQIRICIENNIVVQYRDEDKTEISRFNLNRNGKYRDHQGTGKISKESYNIELLKTQILTMFNFINNLKNKYADYDKPTFVHNPNYEFMQPSTLTQLIMSDKDFECPKRVAEIISGFVVERKITIPVHIMDDEGFLDHRTTQVVPAQKKMSDLWGITGDYDIVKMCIVFSNEDEFSTSLPDVDYDDADEELQMLMLMGEPGEEYEGKSYQLPSRDALVGDVFGQNYTSLVINTRYETHFVDEAAHESMDVL